MPLEKIDTFTKMCESILLSVQIYGVCLVNGPSLRHMVRRSQEDTDKFSEFLNKHNLIGAVITSVRDFQDRADEWAFFQRPALEPYWRHLNGLDEVLVMQSEWRPPTT